MAADIVTLVPPDKRDAALIAQCEAFDELDEQILEHNLAVADAVGRGLGYVPPQNRQAEYEALLIQLCRRRATSLRGIAARVRTLLRYAPECFELQEADGYDELLIAALLRDLALVLRIHETRYLAGDGRLGPAGK